MPNIKYTAAKGLVQSTGSGSPNLFHCLAPSDVASTAVPGGTLAIPVTHAVVAKTTGGAENLTLANGVPGQFLTIYLAGDGGDGILAPAQGTTATGWATIVFADVGDRAVLYYVNDTVGWIIMSLSGTTTSPVSTV